MPSSKGTSPPRDQICVCYVLAGGFFATSTTAKLEGFTGVLRLKRDQWGWILPSLMSLHKEEETGGTSFSTECTKESSYKDMGSSSKLQAEKRGLTKSQIFWYLNLGLLEFRNVKETMFLFFNEPPRLWHCYRSLCWWNLTSLLFSLQKIIIYLREYLIKECHGIGGE